MGWFLNLGTVVTTIVDAIFGTDWTSGLNSLADSVTAWGKNENAITLDKTAPTIDYRMEYSTAWDSGYNWGSNLFSGFDFAGANSLTDTTLQLDPSAYSNLSNIADNTKAISDSVSVSEDEMMYMRDIAEREAINRYTTAEIKVDMSGMQNNIAKDIDAREVMDIWANEFAEMVNAEAEGVYDQG